jgi:hypothetical protein
MSNVYRLRALVKKNWILMKRNWLATICEIVFPMILMVLLILVRNIIPSDTKSIGLSDQNYIMDKSSALITFNETFTNQTLQTPWNQIIKTRNPL